MSALKHSLMARCTRWAEEELLDEPIRHGRIAVVEHVLATRHPAAIARCVALPLPHLAARPSWTSEGDALSSDAAQIEHRSHLSRCEAMRSAGDAEQIQSAEIPSALGAPSARGDVFGSRVLRRTELVVVAGGTALPRGARRLA